MISKQELTSLLVSLTARELKIAEIEVNIHANFSDMGMDSLSAMYILDELEARLKKEVNPLLFWEHPTIDAFATSLVKHLEVRS